MIIGMSYFLFSSTTQKRAKICFSSWCLTFAPIWYIDISIIVIFCIIFEKIIPSNKRTHQCFEFTQQYNSNKLLGSFLKICTSVASFHELGILSDFHKSLRNQKISSWKSFPTSVISLKPFYSFSFNCLTSSRKSSSNRVSFPSLS